jgi:hypothetical protein
MHVTLTHETRLLLLLLQLQAMEWSMGHAPNRPLRGVPRVGIHEMCMPTTSIILASSVHIENRNRGLISFFDKNSISKHELVPEMESDV